MKKEVFECDICQSVIPTPSHPPATASKNLNQQIMVVFTTDQTEGRSTSPYISIDAIDVCDRCIAKILQGNAVFAEGAMGYNKYYFKT